MSTGDETDDLREQLEAAKEDLEEVTEQRNELKQELERLKELLIDTSKEVAATLRQIF